MKTSAMMISPTKRSRPRLGAERPSSKRKGAQMASERKQDNRNHGIRNDSSEASEQPSAQEAEAEREGQAQQVVATMRQPRQMDAFGSLEPH